MKGLTLPPLKFVGMEEARKRVVLMLRCCLYGIVGAGVIGVVWHWTGVFYNVSPSMPTGLYVYYPASTIKFGDTVIAHPSLNKSGTVLALKRGYVFKGEKWLKEVVGVPGDSIDEQTGIISVCHADECHLLKCLRHDEQGLPLICANFSQTPIIPKRHYFLEGTHSPKSYDSRYMGLFDQNEISSKAAKLL